MNIQLTLAARYLWGRKLRTTLTTLAVVFGVVVLFGMNILLPSMLQSFQANILAASNQVDVTISHKTGEAFSPDLLDKVARVEGVVASTGLLNRPVNLPAEFYDNDPNTPDAVSTLSLVGLDPDTARTVRNYSVDEGRFLENGDKDAAVIAKTLADALGLKLGDTLTLPSTQGTAALTIVGIRPARTIPGNEEVLVTLAEAQRLLNQSSQINIIEANFAPGDEAKRKEILSNIEAALGDNFQFGALSSGTELFASLKIGQVVISLFGFAALVMGGFIIFNTFRTIVLERRRDIAMLRSVGASRNTILGFILAEGFLQGVLGTAIGVLLGYLLGVGSLSGMSGMMERFIHIKLGGPVISPGLIVTTILLGIGTPIAAGLFPALAASNVAPLEALRPTPLEVEERAMGRGGIIGVVLIVLAVLGLFSGQTGLAGLGLLLFLIGLILIAPVLVKPIARFFSALMAVAFARDGIGSLAQGNLTRQPTRAAVTTSVTMIALAIIVSVGGMVASIRGSFLDIVKRSLGSDYLLIPPAIAVWGNNVGADNSLADQLRAVDGVGVVGTTRFAAAAANDSAVSLLGIDPVEFPQVANLVFDSGEAQTAYAEMGSGRALIINAIMAANLRLKVGDTVALTTPEGMLDYRVAAVASDYFNAKIITAYISQANLEQDFHKTEDVFIQFNLAPGADRAAVEPRLRAIVAEYPQFRFVSGQAYYEENALIFEQVFTGLYVLFLVLAIPSLIAILNTLAIGVLERTREIGMLRAVGATQSQVRRMVLAEAVLLSAIGTAFGLLAGVYLSYVMVTAMQAAGFPFLSYAFPLYGILSAVAIGLIFGVVAALIPARQAAKLEIVQALRYE